MKLKNAKKFKMNELRPQFSKQFSNKLYNQYKTKLLLLNENELIANKFQLLLNS